jgi:hypothetical protein
MINALKFKAKVFDDTLGEDKIRVMIPGIVLKSGIKVINIHTVTVNEEMRPDLISMKYYGSTDYWDLILKMNAISNPFSVKAGMELEIPDRNAAERFIVKIPRIDKKAREQFTNPKRMNQQDKKRQEFLQKKSASKPNGSKENLPPNMLKSDEKVKIFKDGKIVLGANIPTNNRNR